LLLLVSSSGGGVASSENPPCGYNCQSIIKVSEIETVMGQLLMRTS